jgi:hypothetical protein
MVHPSRAGRLLVACVAAAMVAGLASAAAPAAPAPDAASPAASDAAGGVDGVKGADFAFHTENEDRPWWQVDLGRSEPLDRVVLWNRCSPDSGRARLLEVHLSDDGKAFEKVYAHDGTVFYGASDSKPLSVPLAGRKARFVRIQLAERNWLHLSEVEVFGQADPSKNLALGRPADQSSTSQWSTGQQVAAAGPSTAWSPPEAPLPPDAMGFDEILFVKRKPYSSDHYYTDINNGTSGDRFVPANGIYVYNLRTKQERAVVTAAALPGGQGFLGKISLSFDARKVLFDFRENPGAGFRIWEVGVDGKGLRQVSHPPADEAEKVARWNPGWHTDDIHPCYLPDGKIIFSSTRSEHTVLCGGWSHLVAPTLHRMDADGSNVEALSNSPVSEFCPVVLSDGRVMYHRWEYIDKGARVAKTIWTMFSDGSKCQEIYGLADDTTTIYMYPQPLPADDGRIVCVGTCHFPQGGCLGAIMLVDGLHSNRERGPDPDAKDYAQWDDRYAVTNLTPHVFIQRRTEPGWHLLTADGRYVHDSSGRSGHLYTHPWPISDTQFLVSYKVKAGDHYKDVPNAYALYLIDTQGRHWPVHKDENLSCWHPTPLVPRKTPPVVRSVPEPAYATSDKALCVVADVTLGMAGVEPGEVKWLRINEALPRYWSTAPRWGPALSSSEWKAALWPRVQWGVVPVEKDGSACFEVPANRSIFFQALDANFREVQRERTYVTYKPGEVRSCTGCHGESGRSVPPASATTPLALGRPPSVPQPQPCDLVENGGTGLAGQVIHYPADIQPILDAKCVSCHGNKDPAGDLTLTADLTTHYSVSYEQLAGKELAGPIIAEFTSFRQGDRGNYNGAYLPPRSLGCYKSVLVEMLTSRAHPKNAKDDHTTMLTDRELEILGRWVDSNYQFYGSYYGRRHSHWVVPDPANPAYDPADLRRKATFAESISDRAPEWHR